MMYSLDPRKSSSFYRYLFEPVVVVINEKLTSPGIKLIFLSKKEAHSREFHSLHFVLRFLDKKYFLLVIMLPATWTQTQLG